MKRKPIERKRRSSKKREEDYYDAQKLRKTFTEAAIVTQGLRLSMYVEDYKLYAREGVYFFPKEMFAASHAVTDKGYLLPGSTWQCEPRLGEKPTSVYNMLIIKNYYEGLPESLEEAAKIDGAGNVRILLQVSFIEIRSSHPAVPGHDGGAVRGLRRWGKQFLQAGIFQLSAEQPGRQGRILRCQRRRSQPGRGRFASAENSGRQRQH